MQRRNAKTPIELERPAIQGALSFGIDSFADRVIAVVDRNMKRRERRKPVARVKPVRSDRHPVSAVPADSRLAVHG